MDDHAQSGPEDWGPFGRPLFDDPKARALSRVGVIDIGSNSVRMVVFDGAARSPAYFFNEKVMCGLGAGFAESGRLNPEGRVRALAAMRRFAKLAEGMGVKPLSAVATAAMREAEDGPEFRQRIETETGVPVWVIDGAEEARLSAQGVLLGWPGAEGLVCDIGGSSMELAQIGAGGVGKRVTSELGPFRLQGIKGGQRAVTKEIKSRIKALAEKMGTTHKRLFLVGGSWRAIARLDMERRGYPLHVLHEYRMTPADVRETVKWIAGQDTAALRSGTGIGEARMALVPLASQVLSELVRVFKPKEIAVSSYGIREGMLYEQMSPELRDRDPLIEACRFQERKDSRLPGFGRALYNFVLPIFAGEPHERLRIVRAACLLHDVSWRAHPDYRHEACFDNATRANLGGLTHPERIFLGLALMHRYKNGRSKRFDDFLGILSENEVKRAEILGRAMRFGAMFSAETPDSLGRLTWTPKKSRLQLTLTPAASDLFGEVAEARFKALATALQAEPVVTRD
ncbi:exopolyphosphatase / guanosine-5'-triphosphate,3'-diphosphate pyrophosphatase [Tranquillimonas rosea]|uniref:Exopolyphosphatase / guanosine-5'-triphosphate,3'-diphosphate pyrophosphatase n=1 Tax=Tranquillimonas rosea TaxID=641238 RepID=A0A1H9VWL5_9RHOB|nr:Ppx/GppA family phosphatase [Tranquillimonas rosea]SES26002.1 exopolyphosphatase / guanosine-5'-triphosphate,3'-diphosphate pyrophosphatase [Tranquillimonas rosea]